MPKQWQQLFSSECIKSASLVFCQKSAWQKAVYPVELNLIVFADARTHTRTNVWSESSTIQNNTFNSTWAHWYFTNVVNSIRRFKSCLSQSAYRFIAGNLPYSPLNRKKSAQKGNVQFRRHNSAQYSHFSAKVRAWARAVRNIQHCAWMRCFWWVQWCLL